ncbi:MAG: 30S ribosomal protein S13 [Candidatus Thorarchaeota archaeon]
MSDDIQDFQFIVRCAGTDCRGDWLIPYALTKIKGLGYRLARAICLKADIDPNRRMGYLTDEETQALEDIINNPASFGIPPYLLNRRKDIATGEDIHVSGSELFIAIKSDVDRLKKIRSYRGIRHSLGLKVRGQRTRTSGRGGQTVGVFRRKLGS